MTAEVKAKFTITLRVATIISLWGSSLLLSWQMSQIYSDIKTRFGTYDSCVKDVVELKTDVSDLNKWRDKVNAYYTKPDGNTQVSQTTTTSKTVRVH